ncbi:cell division protein ZapA [Henriciella marina]|uniref:cell division protein ZapA n=1 Tax=Henriciella marina TaxID=453851 RepID=UPI000368B5CA|nr:cell division protein ZapA [Henriciella marina]
MAKADITIRGKHYSVACAPGQEDRLVELSTDLDARIRQIAEAVGDLGEEKLLLVAALALLDELDDAKRARPVPAAGGTQERTVDAIGDAAARIRALTERIEAGQ